jgi:hypothetical protein
LQNAERNEKGAFYDYLPAMVFSALTFEAYLNFVGEKLAPSFWKKERDHFRKTGLPGRTRKVLELCGMPEPDMTIEPYSTIWELKKLRDVISHGESVSLSIMREHDQNNVPDFTGYDPLSDLVTPEKERLAAQHVGTLAQMIHTAAKQLIEDPWFESAELGHNLGHRSHTVSPT